MILLAMKATLYISAAFEEVLTSEYRAPTVFTYQLSESFLYLLISKYPMKKGKKIPVMNITIAKKDANLSLSFPHLSYYEIIVTSLLHKDLEMH
jgi:hypothetical protein